MNFNPLIIYAADIGSIKNKHFGWCRLEYNNNQAITGDSINDLAQTIMKDLQNGLCICLGFECPLFVGLSDNPNELTSKREGEGSRPWSAGAGCGSLATGLVEVLWVFERLAKSCKFSISPTFRVEDILEGKSNFLLWEAFISENGKGHSHIEDSTIAATEFSRRLRHKSLKSDVTVANAYSLVGAALLRSGITTDICVLSEPCIVVKK